MTKLFAVDSPESLREIAAFVKQGSVYNVATVERHSQATKRYVRLGRENPGFLLYEREEPLRRCVSHYGIGGNRRICQIEIHTGAGVVQPAFERGGDRPLRAWTGVAHGERQRADGHETIGAPPIRQGSRRGSTPRARTRRALSRFRRTPKTRKPRRIPTGAVRAMETIG